MILPWDQMYMMKMMEREGDQMIYRGVQFIQKRRVVKMIQEKREKGSRCEIRLITTETIDELKSVQNQNNSGEKERERDEERKKKK